MPTTVDRVYVVTTKSDPLRIRSGPGTSYGSIGTKAKGAKVNCTQISDDGKWAFDKDANGWLCINAGAGYDYLTLESSKDDDPQSDQTETATDVPIEADPDAINYVPYLDSFYEYDRSIENRMPVKTIKGILGMPYQFMKETDTRLLDENSAPTQFGRKYADKILTKLPMLFITPGKPTFLQGFSKDSKKNILTTLAEKYYSLPYARLEELIDGQTGRYYTFNMAYSEYYQYLNPMCQITARYLGIHNQQLFGTILAEFDWGNYTDPAFKTFISAKESLGFYIDSPSQISDSFSNSTGESMLEGLISPASDLSREIGFLLGAGAGIEIDALKEENFETTQAAIEKIGSSMNGLEVIKRFKSGLQTVAMGGKILFPEIWNDSEFTRSYDIDIKLRTPAGDTLSWYLNIMVPILHLIALTAPKQLDANGYNSPFLVRAFYKGLFNIDMGIITSMTINKGAQAAWTIDGLPTEVDINLQIKDLYSALSITKNTFKHPTNVINNTYLLDYLANSCGININKPEILRSIDIYLNQVGTIWKSLPSRVWTDFQNSLSNGLLNIYDKYVI